jgi:catechol 2,3-dioxygenase-like lactoylglutathione lyase family enzyme
MGNNLTIRHTGLVVKNLKKSKQFWINYFGFKVRKEIKEKGKILSKVLGLNEVIIKTCKMFDKKNNMLELIYFYKPKIKNKKTFVNSNGFTHIAINVDDLDKFYNKFKKKIIFNNKPQTSEDGKVKFIYCKTPEGAYVELVEEIK